MSSSGVKFSGVKIVPQSDLRAGTTSGNSWQRAKHMDIFLGTWNIRTLYSSGALEILTRELDRTGLDREGSQESGKFTLYYGEFLVRLVTFATSKNLIINSTTFQHKDIHKYTWTSPEGETRNQIDHVLVDKRWHSSIIHCNSDHHLVRVKIREWLALMRGTDTKRLEYQIKITNRFETLECSEKNVATEEETNINREWETIRDTIKLSASESYEMV
ncbi:hypothetical protein C0J52_27649 [Blattella germanica]|nr:hypothetical protein C0J52_27649 [Blattella germanica]